MQRLTWRIFYFLISAIFFNRGMSAQEVAITGVYQGKPLFIQNPLSTSGQFCIQNIYLNGRTLDINLNISAIEIAFKGLDLYTPVSVRVAHDSLCLPKIVNPQAVFWHSSFRFTSLSVSTEELKWATRGEREKGLYRIEKLNADEWMEIATVESKGQFSASEYLYYPEHSEGDNKYRIKYETGSSVYLYSDEAEVVFYKEPITFSPRVVTEKMTLSRAAAFEILDSSEKVILTGNAKEIPLRLLKPGTYYIVLDGVKESFVKR